MKVVQLPKFMPQISITVGVLIFLYGISFLLISRQLPELGNLISPLFLMLIGLFSIDIYIGLFRRLSTVQKDFAYKGFVLSILGALGSIVHGGYDLANAIAEASSTPAFQAALPNPVDPMGLLSIGLSGLGIMIWGNLIDGAKNQPKYLSHISYKLGATLIILYLARLIIGNPTHFILGILAFWLLFIIYPLWYLYLGLSFFKHSSE